MKVDLGTPSVWIRRPLLAPWLLLLFLGLAALGAWFLIGPALGPGWYYKPGFRINNAYAYNVQLLLLFLPYGLALLAWHRGARAPLSLLLTGAVALHVLVLLAPLPQSQDFYQYLFYGRMQAHYGVNPYVVDPSTFSGDPWYVWIKWHAQPSVYGPVWTAMSAAVARLAGDSLATAFVSLKVVVLALDLATMGLIAAVARAWGRGQQGAAWGVLAYGWNPMVLVSVPLAGSADIVLAVGVLGAVLARRRGRPGLATILLTVAALVKIYAIIPLALHLVLLAREEGPRALLRHAGGAAALAAAAFAPYWAGLSTFTGLLRAGGLANLSLTGTLSRLLGSALDTLGLPAARGVASVTVRVAATLLLVAVLVWVIRRIRDELSLWHGVVIGLLGYLVLSPWFMYWYVLAPMTLVASLPTSALTYPILAFSGTSLVVLEFPPRPLAWALQAVARYGSPAALLALSAGARVGETRDGARMEYLMPTTSGVRRPRAAAE